MDYSCSILDKRYLIVVESDGFTESREHKFKLPYNIDVYAASCRMSGACKASGENICIVGYSRKYDKEVGHTHQWEMHMIKFRNNSIQYMQCIPLEEEKPRFTNLDFSATHAFVEVLFATQSIRMQCASLMLIDALNWNRSSSRKTATSSRNP